MKTKITSTVLALFGALGLFTTPAVADVFVSAHAPGMCLHSDGSNRATIDVCRPGNPISWSGYGTMKMGSQCLGTSTSNPEGKSLEWETCLTQTNKPAGNRCRNTADQCWAHDPTSGKLNNEDGWAADIEGESRRAGARVIAYKYGGGSNQRWMFGNVVTVAQYASSGGYNSVGRAQLQAFDRYVSSNLATLVAAGGGNIIAAGGSNLVAAGGGNVVTNVRLISGLVAAGAGNLVAAGAGNLVAAGAGNLVSGRAGNVGAGNLINFSAPAIERMGGGQVLIGTVASLIGNDGGSLIGNDGGSLIGNDGAGLRAGLANYFSGMSNFNLAAAAASMVAANPSSLVAAGSLTLTGRDVASMMRSSQSMAGRTYGLQSVDLPATINPAMIAALLRIKSSADPVFAKYERMVAAGSTISQDVRTAATQLRTLLTQFVVRNQAISSAEESSVITQISRIDAALSAPPVAVPPPVVVAPPIPPRPVVPPPPPSPPPAPALPTAQPSQAGTFNIIAASGKCLAPGTGGSVLIWDCVNSPNQLWQRTALGQISQGGQCVGNSGNQLRLESCGGSGATHQLWVQGGSALRNSNVPPYCMDVGGSGNGTAVNAVTCNGGSAQNWSLRAAAPPVAVAPPAPPPPPSPPVAVAANVNIYSSYAGKCLAPGAAGGVLIWDCVNNPNQLYERTSLGQLKQNGQCLGNSGNTLVLQSCGGSGAIHQLWIVEAGALKNRNQPSYCLDIENGGRGNGTKVLAWNCHGGPNQQWELRNK